MIIFLFSGLYKHLIKPIFFLFNPERVHNFTTSFGELIGRVGIFTKIISILFVKKSPKLKQKIAGITFEGPVGLAAGFDYEARVVNILPSVGFNFNTVGTITNIKYNGNPKPRLGRLPMSRSLMVNKGFKNQGAEWTSEKLKNRKFAAPLGISIGKTNIKEIDTQKAAIKDILSAFEIFESKSINNMYYELNISCPNLFGNVSFYPAKNLNDLLNAVDKMKLSKPVFIKMPISESNQSIRKMLDVIVKHNVKGVIFGNLQKDRSNPALYKEEIKWLKGNFSGLPTQRRSDELISMAYKNYGKKLIIIGCGGIFSTEDAYRKIKLGASLVQLITGIIYEGPLLPAKINKELPKYLKKDGYKNLSEAIGSANQV